MTETPYGQDDMSLSSLVDTSPSPAVDPRLEPARPDAGAGAPTGGADSDPDRPAGAAGAAADGTGQPAETDLAYLPEPGRIDALNSPAGTLDDSETADPGLLAHDSPAGTLDDSEAADPGLRVAAAWSADEAAGMAAGQAGRQDPGTAGVPTWPWEEADDGELLPSADGADVAGDGTGSDDQHAAAGSDAAGPPDPTGGGGLADKPASTVVDDATGLFAASPSREAADAGEELADPERLRAAVEAVLLVVDTPTSATSLAQGLGRPVDEVVDALRFLRAEYEAGGRGMDLREIAEGWRLYSREEFAPYVERFVLYGQQARLTQAALETLAVIAYRQPVTRSRIGGIRGVSVDAVMRTLLTRGLVEECGADPDTGGGLYRTTRLFLEKVGLRSLEELPSLAPLLPDTSQLDDVAVST
jgi:segregation and condensation protein B